MSIDHYYVLLFNVHGGPDHYWSGARPDQAKTPADLLAISGISKCDKLLINVSFHDLQLSPVAQ